MNIHDDKRRINIKIVLPFLLGVLLVLILLGFIIFLRLTDDKGGVERRIDEVPVAILAENVPEYLEKDCFDIPTTGYGDYKYQDNYFDKEKDVIVNKSKTTLSFDLPENSDYTEKKIKLFLKSGDSYIEIIPESSEAKEAQSFKGYTHITFSFILIDKFKDGDYYRIEYGPYTIDFMMGTRTVRIY